MTLSLDKACVISNSDSGTNLKRGVAGVEAVARGAGLRHCLVDSMAALSSVLRDCGQRGDELIVVNAGDGTVCRVLEHLRNDTWFDQTPVLALLRGGTTNMIHNDVGVPGNPESALRGLLKSQAENRCRLEERHVLRVRRSSGRRPRYGFFLGTHAVPRAIRRVRARLHRRMSTGRLSELSSMAGLLWRLLRRRVEQDPILSPVSLEIRADDEPWRRGNHVMLLVLSVRRALFGIRPLRHGQKAGMAILNWPDYRLGSWVAAFLNGTLREFQAIALRGDFEWILDGEFYRHRSSDGELLIEVDAPARFLLPR